MLLIPRETKTNPPPQATTDTVSSVGSYYPWLDALRGISWILVMIGHTTSYGYLARMGVGIFFAISGWLITKIILGQQNRDWSLVNFYTRRAIRIIPLYYLLIAAACFVSYYLPNWKSHFEFLPHTIPEYKLWPYLFTFSTEYWRGGGGGFLVGHCWSLCVEERFYVFWPILLTLWPRHRSAQKWLIIIMGFIWYLAIQRLSIEETTVVLFAMPFPLLFGCALAIFSPFNLKSTSRLITLPWAFLFFLAYSVFAWYTEHIYGPSFCTFSLLSGIFAVGLVASAIVTEGNPSNLFIKFLQEAGKLSYGAYLFHPIFAFIAIKLANIRGVIWLGPILGVAMCTPVAYFIHKWVELPILNKRAVLESSRTWRTVALCIQTIPITIGLILLFPWQIFIYYFLHNPRLIIIITIISICITFCIVSNFFDRLSHALNIHINHVCSKLSRYPEVFELAIGINVVLIIAIFLLDGFSIKLKWLSISMHRMQHPIIALMVMFFLNRYINGKLINSKIWTKWGRNIICHMRLGEKKEIAGSLEL